MSGLAPLTLLLGGARSGKSRHALRMAQEGEFERIYVATAWAGDEEMARRIAHHQQERGDKWRLIEEPFALGDVIARQARPGRLLLIDCLTLWLSNLMGAARDVTAETERLVADLEKARGPVILISNEVGLGLVPETPLGRAFRDHQGWLNQQVAAIASTVIFVAAGLPLVLKAPKDDT